MTSPLDAFRQRTYYLHDLLEADRARSVKVFSVALCGYLNKHPRENLADVEKWLRKNHCWTRLIAAEADPTHPLHPPVLRGKPSLFELFISTKDPEHSMNELIQRAHDEETNLKRLEVTGVHTVKSRAQAIDGFQWDNQHKPGGMHTLTDLGVSYLNDESID